MGCMPAKPRVIAPIPSFRLLSNAAPTRYIETMNEAEWQTRKQRIDTRLRAIQPAWTIRYYMDIPALEFIVFLRSVKSRILWEQMLGRGTRLCHDINKSKFVIFDCFDGTLIQYFKTVSSFDIEPPRGTPLTIPEVIENIWQNVDRDYHARILAKRLLRIDKDMNGDARTLWLLPQAAP
jgi:hypothetical protein